MDNHVSTLSLFVQAGCSSWYPTNSVKALKAHKDYKTWAQAERGIQQVQALADTDCKSAQ